MFSKQVVLVLGILLILVGFSQAQLIGPFVHGGYYVDQKDFFLGAGVDIGVLMLHAVPNFEYVFVDQANYYTLNIDGHWDILSLPGIVGYIGGGLATVSMKPRDGETGAYGGFNLIAGVKAKLLPLNPFLRAKYLFAQNNQFVLAVGIHF